MVCLLSFTELVRDQFENGFERLLLIVAVRLDDDRRTLAGSYSSEVWLEKGPRRINAKSIMGVMMLAAAKGSTIVIDTEGSDADAAMAALQALIADKFGEGE